MEKILITGSSSGFGTLMVRALRAAGHQVAASMRAPTGRSAAVAEELSALGAHIVELDVTSDASVSAGVSRAVEALGGLTVLVNNAGVGVLGLQESFTPEDLQRLFEVNVFGVQRVNRAVLPHFRAERRGLLVHVSSLLGRVTVPFYGPYNASKWALEALAENYRAELSPFGVESAIIEPGGFPTAFSEHLLRPSDRSREPEYGELAAAPERQLAGFEAMLRQFPDQVPSRVADAVVTLLAAPRGKRPFRTAVDFIGMGSAIEPYNQHLAELTRGLYQNMQIAHLLEPAV
jgi:NAD(P)-dependent dehydrogenase (short-subunit alcohol dehydrogenase family)